ncbi:hypothetical protein H7K05_25525 [Priestia aryabhattai]|uniref:hypothetical protein n=1 Tax=Priestia aryabhattai TaxID=412384 RepID=UPI001C8E675B|nr:hypothetical protein [Priestia aryabhattai]MBY0008684.1 hypothetical protein [Priestia aryabhattai]MBY0045300.1 hypothetical protein [Priestia aryabhattai]
MEENYRLMFVFRTRDISMLYCLGMDYTKGAMFCVMFYSPNDDIQLNHNTGHYPPDLIRYLSKEKNKIDTGAYDIRTWSLDLNNKDSK